MDNTQEGTSRPLHPMTGEAGDWRTYHAGNTIPCPGIKDRRNGERGDRRSVARPCTMILGCPAPGSLTMVRVHERSMKPAPGPSHYLFCRECKRTIEFMNIAVSEAA